LPKRPPTRRPLSFNQQVAEQSLHHRIILLIGIVKKNAIMMIDFALWASGRILACNGESRAPKDKSRWKISDLSRLHDLRIRRRGAVCRGVSEQD
jgi:hypothetical protein